MVDETRKPSERLLETRCLRDAGFKKCTTCKEVKAHSLFQHDRTKWDGISAACKECVRIKEIKRQNKKKSDPVYLAHHQARQRAWFKNNPKRKLLYYARRNAKLGGWDFNLTLDDIFIPDVCPISGIKLERSPSPNKYLGNAPSVDRINSNQGYVKGNVRIISWRMNCLKSNFSLLELKNLLNYMECDNGVR